MANVPPPEKNQPIRVHVEKEADAIILTPTTEDPRATVDVHAGDISLQETKDVGYKVFPSAVPELTTKISVDVMLAKNVASYPFEIIHKSN